MAHFHDDDCEPIDLSYFFGPGNESVRIDPILYPDRSVIEKSAVEHDWGDRTPALNKTWRDIKGVDTNTTALVIIGLFLLAASAYAAWKRTTRRSKTGSGQLG